MKNLIIDTQNHITTILINRPQAKNAVDGITAQELAEAFEAFDKDDNRIGGWPIDPSDWEDFHVNSVEFALNDNEDPMYILNIVDAS